MTKMASGKVPECCTSRASRRPGTAPRCSGRSADGRAPSRPSPDDPYTVGPHCHREHRTIRTEGNALGTQTADSARSPKHPAIDRPSLGTGADLEEDQVIPPADHDLGPRRPAPASARGGPQQWPRIGSHTRVMPSQQYENSRLPPGSKYALIPPLDDPGASPAARRPPRRRPRSCDHWRWPGELPLLFNAMQPVRGDRRDIEVTARRMLARSWTQASCGRRSSRASNRPSRLRARPPVSRPGWEFRIQAGIA